MDLLWFILIVIASGWLASQIMKGGSSGLVGNLIVGVIGALIGGVVIRLLGFAAVGLLGQLITATIGAIIMIALLRKFGRRV